MTHHEAEEVWRKFVLEFYIDGPLANRVSSGGLSKIGDEDPDAREDEKDLPCIAIRLRKELPIGINFHGVIYHGLKIFTKLVGDSDDQYMRIETFR